MMRTFSITLGNSAPEGEDYGTYEGETAADALVACRRDADPSREYATPEQLSTSAGFGRGHTGVVNGNGAAARDDWWYVSDAASGQFVGIYTVADAHARP